MTKVNRLTVEKRLIFAMGLIILPLLVVSQTQAKRLERMPPKPTFDVVLTGDPSRMNAKDAAEFKARLLYVMANNPKAARAISKCGVPIGASTNFAPGFWSCLSGCMRDVGVSAVSLIMCGASCAAAGTGIGAIVCAVCVGVSVTVIEVCALGCAMGFADHPALEESQVKNLKRLPRTPEKWQTRLRLQPTRSKA